MDIHEEMKKTAERIEERIDALAAHHNMPAIAPVTAILLTLDGTFDVMINSLGQLSDDDDVRDGLAEAFIEMGKRTMVVCTKNAFAAANVDQAGQDRVMGDILEIVAERRKMQDRIIKSRG